MQKMNKLRIIVMMIIFLLGIFCLIADAANLLPLPNFPISVIGACLGAIVTSIITVFLLKAQTLEKAKAERTICGSFYKKLTTGVYSELLFII